MDGDWIVARNEEMEKERKRYRLAPGAQVREEDFGLLFYTMNGPRLYFLSCGGFLGSDFFNGRYTMDDWMEMHGHSGAKIGDRLLQVESALSALARKGVVHEC